MGVLMNTEIDKLSVMYEGDKNRDATDKIRGFLFQEFDPLFYIDSSVTDYVCLNFPEDKYVNHSVILHRAGGNFKGVKRKIVERMVSVSPKPGKWFFENSKIIRGKNYYSYSTANVNENPTVASSK